MGKSGRNKMTDKDIKDYCKNCNVEPPAMRFKCPECEHNSDKEQIIIDGVDVSECLFYQANFEEDYDVRIKHFCSNWHNSCESINNSNCYFKQLARKTQECEELKEKYEEIKEDRYNLNMEMYTLDRYRKALEEIDEFCITYSDNHDAYETVYKYILDIINKAKGEE